MKPLSLIFTLLLAFLCMAPTTVNKPTHITINASSGSCPVTVGTLTLSANVSRSSGISPLFVWFDPTNGGQGGTGNTGTTDTALTGNTNVWQDVTFSYSYGDAGVSGTGTWAYGSNAGHNSTNASTGLIGGHLYVVTPGSGDKVFNTVVTAFDGTNTASCTLGVTVYDPNGANGFPGSATTCQANGSLPVAGSGGCPSGAVVVNSATEASIGSNQRRLYHCGDSFSGSPNINSGASKWSVGAYGGCENTTISRPIMAGGYAGVSTSPVFSDGRIIDLDFESTSYAVTVTGLTIGAASSGPLTLYNLASNNNTESYYMSQINNYALIASEQFNEVNVGTYFNYAENNCTNGSSALNCGGTPLYTNVNYQALIGNTLDGNNPPPSPGNETVRFSACRMCIISNNVLKNAATGNGAVLKMHEGNTYNSNTGWIGAYTELVEISDNVFTGTSGANLVETCAQSATREEHLRNIVVERNIFQGNFMGGGRGLLACVDNLSFRDNVIYGAFTTGSGGTGVQSEQRSTAGGPPQFAELYNNTCHQGGNMVCVSFTHNDTASGTNSWAMNNLVYLMNTVSANTGTGNTISNNTTNTALNPSFVNGSGGFTLISDWKPTANYTGAASANPAVPALPFPVDYDALGIAWSPTWDLGAVKH